MPSETPTTTPDVITKPTITVDFVVMGDTELEKPYRVIIQNDDVTPMEFVIAILVTIFALTYDQAAGVMLEAHYEGRALVAVLPLKEAQERVYDAQSVAREAGYPLSFYLEPDE